MSQQLCLRCGNQCASYATQCRGCQRFLRAPFTPNQQANQQITKILGLVRCGNSFAATADAMNQEGEPNLQTQKPWSAQNIGYVVHQFTQDKPGIGPNDDLSRCERCQCILPEPGERCAGCGPAPEEAAKKHVGMGRVIVIYNLVCIAILVVYFPACDAILEAGDVGVGRLAFGYLAVVLFVFGLGAYLMGNFVLLLGAWASKSKGL